MAVCHRSRGHSHRRIGILRGAIEALQGGNHIPGAHAATTRCRWTDYPALVPAHQVSAGPPGRAEEAQHGLGPVRPAGDRRRRDGHRHRAGRSHARAPRCTGGARRLQLRHVEQVHQAGARRRALPGEGLLEPRLQPVRARARGPARALHLPRRGAASGQAAAHPAARVQLVAAAVFLGRHQGVRPARVEPGHGAHELVPARQEGGARRFPAAEEGEAYRRAGVLRWAAERREGERVSGHDCRHVRRHDPQPRRGDQAREGCRREDMRRQGAGHRLRRRLGARGVRQGRDQRHGPVLGCGGEAGRPQEEGAGRAELRRAHRAAQGILPRRAGNPASVV